MTTLDRTAVPRRGNADRVKKGLVSGKFTALLILLPPALILFSLFVILPLADAVYYSGFSWNGYGAPSDFVGSQNYQRLLDHSVFHTALWNTAKLILVSLLIQMPLALGLALLVYRKTPTNTLFRLVFFLPYILAEVAAGSSGALFLTATTALPVRCCMPWARSRYMYWPTTSGRFRRL